MLTSVIWQLTTPSLFWIHPFAVASGVLCLLWLYVGWRVEDRLCAIEDKLLSHRVSLWIAAKPIVNADKEANRWVFLLSLEFSVFFCLTAYLFVFIPILGSLFLSRTFVLCVCEPEKNKHTIYNYAYKTQNTLHTHTALLVNASDTLGITLTHREKFAWQN